MPQRAGDGMSVLKPTPHHCSALPGGGVQTSVKVALPPPTAHDGRQRWREPGSQHEKSSGVEGVHGGGEAAEAEAEAEAHAAARRRADAVKETVIF